MAAGSTLIIADVDFFKRFNDPNGDQAGDKCLIEVANLFTEAVKRPRVLAPLLAALVAKNLRCCCQIPAPKWHLLSPNAFEGQ